MDAKTMRRSVTADDFTNNHYSVNTDLKDIRCFDENPRDESWTRHERHFFIITDASRPVYCRYGNELNVTPLLCTIVAFTGQLVRDGNQKLQTIVAGNKLFVFYLPLPFIFVCVSSIKLPVSLIMKELQILEQIIFSILTPNIIQTLQKRPNFDIKKQTSSNESHFTLALELMDNYQTFIFHEYIPMCAIAGGREKYAQIIHSHQTKGIYAFLIFYQDELLCYVESKNFKMTTDDFHILLNNANLSMISNMLPICLPNRENIFHVLAEVREDINCAIALVTEDIDAGPLAASMSENVISEFKSQNLGIPEIIPPLKNPEIKHFIIAHHELKQVYSPFISTSDELSKTLYRSYAWAYEYLKSSNIKGQFYIATDELTLFGKHDQKKTIIAAANLGCPATKAQELLDILLDYIKKYKNSIFDFKLMKWND